MAMRVGTLGALVLAAQLWAGRAHAAEPTADEIATRMLSHDTFGFEGTEVKARLVLIERDGRREERAFDAISKKGPDQLIKSVIRMKTPTKVAGTAFLMIQHRGAPDEQYIHLPAMRSTRRIGGTGERQGSFMNSDFSYADLERKDLREATYARLPDEAIGAHACYVLEAKPTSGEYSKVVAWIRQKDWVVLRTQMFGKDGALAKTMFTRRVELVDGKPVIKETHTENAKTGHQTDFVIDELRFSPDLPESMFTPSAL